MVSYTQKDLEDSTISSFFVWQKGKKVKQINLLYAFIAGISIYSMVIPAVLMDIFIWQYQLIYFTFLGIPKLKRGDYVIMDRYHLDGLTLFQKIDCLYCGYVNGLVAYAKDVANQTEIYSCAIKHRLKAKGQKHQKNFYPQREFVGQSE